MSPLLCLGLRRVVSRETSFVVMFSFVSFFEIQEYPAKKGLEVRALRMQKRIYFLKFR